MRSQSSTVLLLAMVFLISVRFSRSQNVYQDDQSGVSVSLPVDWTWSSKVPLEDQASIVTLREGGSTDVVRFYVKVLEPPEEPMPAQKMNKRLLKQADAKVRQRIGEGYENYRLRKESCVLKSINGRSALSWVDDYTVRGRPMVEYLTRVRSENTNALFFARLPAEELDDFKARIDPIVETLQIR